MKNYCQIHFIYFVSTVFDKVRPERVVKHMVKMRKYAIKRCRTIIQLSAIYIFFANCFSFDMDPKEAATLFPKDKVPVFKSYTIDSCTLRYVSLDTQKKKSKRPLILFVHGSPGGWSAYIDYLKDPQLQRAAKLISVDRLGYGASSFKKGTALSTIKFQAKAIEPILASHAGKGPIILVGHSLGGAIVSRLSMDYTKNVQALLLIASSISPDVEKPAWYNKLGNFFLVRWILPKDLETSNREILPLRGELEKMRPLWKKIKIPVTVIHGKKDTLVPPSHIDFLKKVLQPQKTHFVLPAEEGHFVLWQNQALIKRELLTLLELVTFKRSGSAKKEK